MGFAREIASRVIFMADGNMQDQGTPEEIFTANSSSLLLHLSNLFHYFGGRADFFLSLHVYTQNRIHAFCDNFVVLAGVEYYSIKEKIRG